MDGKQTDRNRTPVDKDTPIVFQTELYNYLAKKAKEKDLTIKEYANRLLTMNLKRDAYLEKNYPNFKIVHISLSIVLTILVSLNRGLSFGFSGLGV
jgi:uncharacterized protein YnzC (UPF0291/DUF896 family)